MHILHESWPLNQILTWWDWFCLHCEKGISHRVMEVLWVGSCLRATAWIPPQRLAWLGSVMGIVAQSPRPGSLPVRGAGTLTVEILLSFDKIGLVKGQSGNPFVFRVSYGVLTVFECMCMKCDHSRTFLYINMWRTGSPCKIKEISINNLITVTISV